MVEAVLADYRTAPISDREKALFGLLESVSRHAHRVRREDIAALRQVGWTAEAIYDAITVCALFNFYNRWTDAMGVGDMSPALYEESGGQLAAYGYLPPGAAPAES